MILTGVLVGALRGLVALDLGTHRVAYNSENMYNPVVRCYMEIKDLYPFISAVVKPVLSQLQLDLVSR